jgi:hypothetical protein
MHKQAGEMCPDYIYETHTHTRCPSRHWVGCHSTKPPFVLPTCDTWPRAVFATQNGALVTVVMFCVITWRHCITSITHAQLRQGFVEEVIPKQVYSVPKERFLLHTATLRWQDGICGRQNTLQIHSPGTGFDIAWISGIERFKIMSP